MKFRFRIRSVWSIVKYLSKVWKFVSIVWEVHFIFQIFSHFNSLPIFSLSNFWYIRGFRCKCRWSFQPLLCPISIQDLKLNVTAFVRLLWRVNNFSFHVFVINRERLNLNLATMIEQIGKKISQRYFDPEVTTILIPSVEGQINDFFFVHLPWNHIKITSKNHKITIKSHTKITKSQNYWKIAEKSHKIITINH